MPTCLFQKFRGDQVWRVWSWWHGCWGHGGFQAPGLGHVYQCGHSAPLQEGDARWGGATLPRGFSASMWVNGMEWSELIHNNRLEPHLAHSKHSTLATFQVSKLFWGKCSIKYFNEDHVYSYGFISKLPDPCEGKERQLRPPGQTCEQSLNT